METIATQPTNNEVVDYSYMEFHTKTENQINSTFLVPFAQENTQQVFGTLTIKVNDTPMTKTPQYILFMLDRSQSMSEPVGRNSTKMEHSKHTIINIVKLVVNSEENCPPVFIQIFVFDDEIDDLTSKSQRHKTAAKLKHMKEEEFVIVMIIHKTWRVKRHLVFRF
jgi:hypothetical protein